MAMKSIPHHVVHDGAGGRVDVVAAGLLDKLGVDPLVDNDEGKLQIALKAAFNQGFLDGIHLVVDNVGDLTIAHTVPGGEMSGKITGSTGLTCRG